MARAPGPPPCAPSPWGAADPGIRGVEPAGAGSLHAGFGTRVTPHLCPGRPSYPATSMPRTFSSHVFPECALHSALRSPPHVLQSDLEVSLQYLAWGLGGGSCFPFVKGSLLHADMADSTLPPLSAAAPAPEPGITEQPGPRSPPPSPPDLEEPLDGTNPEVPHPDLAPVAFFCLRQTTSPRNWCIKMLYSELFGYLDPFLHTLPGGHKFAWQFQAVE
ncbi:hypothetical protein STEG23_034333 [Scotinomys teguina]